MPSSSRPSWHAVYAKTGIAAEAADSSEVPQWSKRRRRPASRPLLALAAPLALPASAIADTAYGSLNNFDVFNDTGGKCYGFSIELDDLHSTDIQYTYDYNHYGVPVISEDC